MGRSMSAVQTGFVLVVLAGLPLMVACTSEEEGAPQEALGTLEAPIGTEPDLVGKLPSAGEFPAPKEFRLVALDERADDLLDVSFSYVDDSVRELGYALENGDGEVLDWRESPAGDSGRAQAVRIRLTRLGAKKMPFYRIVAEYSRPFGRRVRVPSPWIQLDVPAQEAP